MLKRCKLACSCSSCCPSSSSKACMAASMWLYKCADKGIAQERSSSMWYHKILTRLKRPHKDRPHVHDWYPLLHLHLPLRWTIFAKGGGAAQVIGSNPRLWGRSFPYVYCCLLTSNVVASLWMGDPFLLYSFALPINVLKSLAKLLMFSLSYAPVPKRFYPSAIIEYEWLDIATGQPRPRHRRRILPIWTCSDNIERNRILYRHIIVRIFITIRNLHEQLGYQTSTTMQHARPSD
jgi:hypothetical protein